jgi:tight adherence protein B
MLLTFLAVVFLIIGIYSILSDLYLRDRSRFSQRVDDEFRKQIREQAQKSALFKNLSSSDLGALKADEPQPTRRQALELMVAQSGLNLTLERLVVITVGTTLGLGALGLLYSVAAGIAGAALGLIGPPLYVHLKRQARLLKLLSQLPDTFDLMARVVRAGQTIPQAVQAVADEFDAPVAAEFSYCYEQQNLGLSPELAFRDLARRSGLLELKIFVLAMLVHQQAGGNLAELLDKLSGVVRERFRIRGKIRSLTAEGRIQALVLLALPPALLGVIMLLNRTYAQVLIEHPNLLIGTFAAELIGALWIRRIINFDY